MSFIKTSLLASPQDLPKVSLSGKKWDFFECDEGDIGRLVTDHGLSEVVAKALLQRNVSTQTARDFLDPKIRNLLPNPLCLKDMEKGTDVCFQAIEAGEKIAIFGDYDVDGATSSALLRRYFRAIGLATELYIPDRLGEGYGPNAEAMENLYAQGIRLVIMVDCGTLAFEPLQRAHDLGLKVIVLDHHLSEENLPKASALINPNRLDESVEPFYLKELCAAGIAFLFIVALQKKLRDHHFFKTQEEPNLLEFLDLVALGTVCDVMPLTHLNRAFVTHGLRLMARQSNAGIHALMEVAGSSMIPTAYHLGFVIGPRINAGGRVGESSLGSQLLFSEDPVGIKNMSLKLHTLNTERQNLEKLMLDQAYAMVEAEKLYEKPVILIGHENWHPGVIGIAASRLKERYNKPSLVVSYLMDATIGKGSGRSIAGASLGEAMIKAVKKGLLVHGGGHAMAAGFTVLRKDFDAFYDFIGDTLKDAVEAYTPTHQVTGWLSLASFTPSFVKSLNVLEPFGHGNPMPKFAIGPVFIRFADPFGVDHMRLVIEDHYGNRSKAVHFRGLSQPYGDLLMKRQGSFYLLGSLKIDSWNGHDDVSFVIEDIAAATV